MGSTYRITANYCPLLNNNYFKCSLNISRYTTKAKNEEKADRTFISFADLVKTRQHQAQRSIVVKLNKFHDADFCREYFSQFGTIKHIWHYTTQLYHPDMILMEYSSQQAINDILDAAKVSTDVSDSVPIQTTVFQFQKFKTKTPHVVDNSVPKYCHQYPTPRLLKSRLKNIESISNQMMMFCKVMKLTDIDIRLRYFTAHQLLLCFSKLFPTISVLPFGSSAAGLGTMGCDLDLVCVFNQNHPQQMMKISNELVFTSKSYSLFDRTHQKEFLRSMSFVMHHFVPGINNTKTILNARVPIIKFIYSFAQLNCDLSSNNMSGFYMTELLYTFTEMDKRVRPLIFTIRKWAAAVTVTVEVPSNKLTNFSLTLLIMFYLQRCKILPPVTKLFRLSDSHRFCQILSTEAIQTQINTKVNNSTLLDLLLGFFEFYGTFDFRTHGICILEGILKPKLDLSPIYIYNPVEPTLNVSRNVSLDELTFFIQKTIAAISVMTKSSSNVKLLDLLRDSGTNRTNIRNRSQEILLTPSIKE
ncbi:mitochondrial poly(A) polymerase [Nomia melanderi]|uniref:mitochondrial poly(A) polymerase n=1 Tax=Nomia melanderi TaxID=2448451 RepID=UPI0013043C07|nr:poly(A) RNA polymerase, mitochondrial [Nomia melanderi]